MDINNSEREIFKAAYISSVGNLTRSVDQQKLYEITVAAGKDLRRAMLNQWIKPGGEEISFEEAFNIYENIERFDLEAIFERIDTQRTGFFQLNELLQHLHKAIDIDEEEKDELIEDIETVRMKLTELEVTGFDNHETERRHSLLEQRSSPHENASLASKETSSIVEEDTEALSPHNDFTFQVRRRAFRLMGNDEKRTLEYRFTIVNVEKVLIELELLISNDQPPERTYSNNIFIALSDINNEQVIAVTKKVINEKYYTEDCILQPGQYSLTFHSCGCIPDAEETDSERLQLIDGTGKLSKHFRVALMNMFDMFDFDENGTLNRAEFDAFNVVASDQHVSDQEWSVLLENFQTRNGELTMSSLIALHQVEAESYSDLEEMWISLKCVGYNSQLLLDMNCPCAFTIQSQTEINLQPVDFRFFAPEEEQMLSDYFWNTGSEYHFDDDINIRLWKSEYFAVGVAGPMDLPGTVTIDYSDSENVIVREVIMLNEMRLHFKRPTILFFAISINPLWFIVLKVTNEN